MADPARRCAGCGRVAGKSELIRVCRLPDKTVVFDPERKMEGRSLYFCPDIKCFEKLAMRRAPEKLLKAKLPDDIRGVIECYLSRPESVL